MLKQHRIIYCLSILITFIIVACIFIKDFNLSWVESNTSYAKVTINFLFPMDQEAFKEHIKLSGFKENQTHFDCSIEWLNEQVVELKLKEKNALKGQKIKLIIDEAPSKIRGISKSKTIPIQFKTDVQLVLPTEHLLISSTGSFMIGFNTPISLQQLSRFLQCNAQFNIKPYEEVDGFGKVSKDDTRFILTPKKALDNGKTYVLLVKAGMRSRSGTILKNDQAIFLNVDQKPSIIRTYPDNGDQWIGLYPHIMLESKEKMVEAVAKIDGKTLKGHLVNNNQAYFILDELLKPETNYNIDFQIQSVSGELSKVKQVSFSTTTLDKQRFWLDVRLGNQKQIKCYEGNKCIRTIPCSIELKQIEHLLGTYYLQSKSEVYEDNSTHLGGNYWLVLSNQLGIQGILRNAYWQPISGNGTCKNIIISDEDAAWLYEKVQEETMIIVRR